MNIDQFIKKIEELLIIARQKKILIQRGFFFVWWCDNDKNWKTYTNSACPLGMVLLNEQPLPDDKHFINQLNVYDRVLTTAKHLDIEVKYLAAFIQGFDGAEYKSDNEFYLYGKVLAKRLYK